MEHNFCDYTLGMIGALENYFDYHLIQNNEDSWSSWDESFNWIEDVIFPMLDAYDDILSADNPFDLLASVEMTSHLNHAGGHLIMDYGSNELYQLLDKFEQNGLDDTFPNWESECDDFFSMSVSPMTLPSREEIENSNTHYCEHCKNGTHSTLEQLSDYEINTQAWQKIEQLHGDDIFYTDMCSACLGEFLELVDKLEEDDTQEICIKCHSDMGNYGELCRDCANDMHHKEFWHSK